MKCRAGVAPGRFEQGWGARRQPHQAGEGAGGARARAHDRAALGIWRGRARSLRLTTHEVAFTLADTNAAIMDRVRDKVKHAETLAAVMAQAVLPRHRGAGEEAYTTLSVIDAPGCSKG
jgi:hypothetical protein